MLGRFTLTYDHYVSRVSDYSDSVIKYGVDICGQRRRLLYVSYMYSLDTEVYISCRIIECSRFYVVIASHDSSTRHDSKNRLICAFYARKSDCKVRFSIRGMFPHLCSWHITKTEAYIDIPEYIDHTCAIGKMLRSQDAELKEVIESDNRWRDYTPVARGREEALLTEEWLIDYIPS
jgi:hypothetical protein